MMPLEDIKQMEENVEMTQGQMYAVAKKKLGKMKVSAQSCWDVPHMFLSLTFCVILSVNRWHTRS